MSQVDPHLSHVSLLNISRPINLVAKGVPFREAHHIVGEAVVEAIRQGKPLEALSLADLQKFSATIGDDVYPILSLQSCLEKRAAKGGVSPQQVAQAITDAKGRL